MSAGVRELNKRVKQWPVFVFLASCALVLVVVGAQRDRGPTTNTERTDAIARTVKCPACAGESVYESRVPVAVAIREEIARQVAAGDTDAEIKAFIDDKYPGTQLVPPAEGANLILWIAPVVVLVLGLGGVALAFRRWRAQAADTGEPDDDDRALVEAALRAEAGEQP